MVPSINDPATCFSSLATAPLIQPAPVTSSAVVTSSVVTSAQKQARFSSKSVSTDGAEGRCLNDPVTKVEPVANLMSSANETVASFLRSIAFKEEDELSQASSFDAPMSTVTFEAPQVHTLTRRPVVVYFDQSLVKICFFHIFQMENVKKKKKKAEVFLGLDLNAGRGFYSQEKYFLHFFVGLSVYVHDRSLLV